MDKATNIMTKIAKKDGRPEPGYWATQMAVARAQRRGDKGWRRGIASDEVIGRRMTQGLKYMVPGAAIGAAGGAGMGLVTSVLTKGKSKPSKRMAAGIGALIGSIPGMLGGSTYGQFRADKDLLAPKGIKVIALGFKRPELTDEAKLNYLLDKYQGGGYKV